MKNVNKSLENWLNELNNFSYKNYEAKPDMDLYMEQMLGYLDRELSIFKTSSLDKQITSSMINNYVKGDVIASPILKKYNREHIAQIEEVCTLKQVLSLQEIKQILDSEYKNQPQKGEIFNNFNKNHNDKINNCVNEAFIKLNQIEENDIKSLNNLALDFAITANTYINIAKRILFLTHLYEFDKENNINQ
jgi:DNA-binding transcriptional MerR regulator